MNLLITDICNKECPYCFAQDKVAIGKEAKNAVHKNISMDNVEKYLDFLAESEEKDFKILGGEPSVHPQFPEIVQRGLDRGFNVIVFTNGIWPKRALEYVENNPDKRLSFVVNINEPHMQTERENRAQAKSLTVMKDRGMISFNIYRPGFSMLFIADFVEKFGIKPRIRLGLAHPVVGKDVDYPSDENLKTIGRELVEQIRTLEKKDILVQFDCGFPVCMFEEKDLGYLYTGSVDGFNSTCNFIVDVGVNLDVWPCFPLSSVSNVKMDEYQNKQEVLKHYQKKLAPVRSMGSMDYCLDCKYMKRGQCCGGCTGRTMVGMQSSGDTYIIKKLA